MGQLTPTGNEALCGERARLTDSMTISASDYAASVSRLCAQIGILTQSNYEKLRSEVEVERVLLERLRASLLEHRNEHKC